jgi:AAA15 family ATPase/GTPase
MLIEFSVANFLSFNEKRTLSLEAASISDYKDTNLAHISKYRILKSAVIYGANSSGKSNLIRAASIMRRIVTHSFKQSSTDEIEVIPFLLNTETIEKPSFFEVLFMLNGNRYRYGFEVTRKEVLKEWLFEAKKYKENLLFVRDKDKIDVSKSFPESVNLESKTRNNALFLTVVDQFNGPIAGSLMKWFNNFITLSGLSHDNYRPITFRMLESEQTKPALVEFFNKLDLGFDEISIVKKEFNPGEIQRQGMPDEILKQLIADMQGKTIVNAETLHKKYDADKKQVDIEKFNLRIQESAGTNKVFDLSGPIFDVLRIGGVLIVDELDAKLHPLLTLAITQLFNSQESNPNNAQLIFATHDTNLLTYGKFRRDQIYFTEKDQYGATDLYSLIDYKEDNKTVRKDRSFERDYFQGRYGAIPFIGNLSKLKI